MDVNVIFLPLLALAVIAWGMIDNRKNDREGVAKREEQEAASRRAAAKEQRAGRDARRP